MVFGVEEVLEEMLNEACELFYIFASDGDRYATEGEYLKRKAVRHGECQL